MTYIELNNKYKQLKKAFFDTKCNEQRQRLLTDINKITNEMREMEKAIIVFHRPTGNYKGEP